MDWSDLRYFLEVIRGGSLAAAARRLKVNQTTVARRLRALEEALGTRLLERTPDGVVLTTAGENIREAGLQMEEAALVVERRATGSDARPSGTVRIATTDLLGAWLVMPTLRALRRSHPDIRCELVTGSRVLDIGRREADVAVRLLRPRGAQLVGRKLGTVGYAVYGSRAYLDAQPVGPPEDGLRDHDLVIYDDSVRPDAACRLADVPVREARPAVRTNSPLALLAGVSAGLGLGELACYLADGRPELRRVWPQRPPHQVDAWLVVHTDLHRTARIRAVMDALTEAFRTKAAALRGDSPAEHIELLAPPPSLEPGPRPPTAGRRRR